MGVSPPPTGKRACALDQPRSAGGRAPEPPRSRRGTVLRRGTRCAGGFGAPFCPERRGEAPRADRLSAKLMVALAKSGCVCVCVSSLLQVAARAGLCLRCCICVGIINVDMHVPVYLYTHAHEYITLLLFLFDVSGKWPPLYLALRFSPNRGQPLTPPTLLTLSAPLLSALSPPQPSFPSPPSRGAAGGLG